MVYCRPPVKLDSDHGWLPHSLDLSAGRLVVTLVRPAGPVSGFVSDLDLRRPSRAVRVALEDIDLPAPDAAMAPSFGLIYHLPRSGSTRAARMLAATGQVRCLIEPEWLNALLSHPQWRDHVSPEWLTRLIRVCTTAFTDRRQVIIKLSSWVIMRHALIARSLPDMPSLFLHRAPGDVLIQLLDRPTGWMAPQARAFILGADSPTTTMPTDEYCARAIGRFCDIAAAAAPRVRPVAYEAGPDALIDACRRHFALALTDADVAAMHVAATRDSEDWSGASAFVPDTDRLRDGDTPRLRDLRAAFADEPYERLLHATR